MYQVTHHVDRADKDPAESWYVGELAFFDKFVIPLATGLRDCVIFGWAPTGKAYLQMTIDDQRLWASNGQNILCGRMEGLLRKTQSCSQSRIQGEKPGGITIAKLFVNMSNLLYMHKNNAACSCY
jgi:hypothetical protein